MVCNGRKVQRRKKKRKEREKEEKTKQKKRKNPAVIHADVSSQSEGCNL